MPSRALPIGRAVVLVILDVAVALEEQEFIAPRRVYKVHAGRPRFRDA